MDWNNVGELWLPLCFWHASQELLYGLQYADIFAVVYDLLRSLYAFHLPQIISTVLGRVNHDEQDGIFAQTWIRGGMSENEHPQNNPLVKTTTSESLEIHLF